MKFNHQNVSFVKSGLRILAGISLLLSNLVVAGTLFILAEGLGVLEEVVEK